MAVPIPGEILKQDIIFGLSFDEIVALAAVPLVLVLPATMIEQIPLEVTFGLVGVGAIIVMAIVLKSPEGQSPVEWFPAYIERRIQPNEYMLKPKDTGKSGKPEIKYLEVFHTAEEVESEGDMSAEEIEEMIDEIEYAEKLEKPEKLLKKKQNSLLNDTFIYIKDSIARKMPSKAGGE